MAVADESFYSTLNTVTDSEELAQDLNKNLTHGQVCF
jgi:hypothetical protein